MSTRDWEAEFKTLSAEAISNLVACDTHRVEVDAKLLPLVVRDTVAKSGWNPYTTNGARLVDHLEQALDAGWIKPVMVTVGTVWRLADADRFLPDWAPFMEDI